MTQHVERLREYIDSGRIIRGQWTDVDKSGRKTACLLAALSPEVADRKSAFACPAEIMPQWLAHLTPWIDDRGTIEAWPGMIWRYANLAARWHVLTPAVWQSLDYRCRIISLDEASRHFDHGKFPKVKTALDEVRRLCECAMAGDFPAYEVWKAAAK